VQFVAPALDRMRGRTINDEGTVEAGFAIGNPGQRRLIVPVRLDDRGRAQPLAGGVAGLGALALASGLLVIPESIQNIAPGDRLTYWSIARTPGEGNNA
jgi:molybdopterin biosynthesis enzyme